MGVMETLKRHPLSPETRAKLSASHMGHPNYGPKHHTLETCARISAAMGGLIRSPETRAKMSAAKMGNTYALGHPASPEKRAKISASEWRGGLRISRQKTNAKRRSLGWNPINSWFQGSDGHHLADGKTVIYVPRWMHRGKGNGHNHYTGRGMARMDALASQFLTEDWT